MFAPSSVPMVSAPLSENFMLPVPDASLPAVLIDQFEEPKTEGGVTRIFASILVDQASQKPIVVGKGGEMIKRIGIEARRDLEEMLGGRVYLELHVKVREDWRDDERLLNEMGLGRR